MRLFFSSSQHSGLPIRGCTVRLLCIVAAIMIQFQFLLRLHCNRGVALSRRGLVMVLTRHDMHHLKPDELLWRVAPIRIYVLRVTTCQTSERITHGCRVVAVLRRGCEAVPANKADMNQEDRDYAFCCISFDSSGVSQQRDEIRWWPKILPAGRSNRACGRCASPRTSSPDLVQKSGKNLVEAG